VKKRFLVAVSTTSLLVSIWIPAAALEPVDPPSPSSAPVTCPHPQGLVHGGECLGPLEAGTYRTTVFTVPITVTVPEGWANYEDLAGNFLLIPPGGSIEGVDAGTSDYIGIYAGFAVADADCVSAPAVGVGTTALEVVTALADRDGLVVTEPEPTSVGGLDGYVIDIVGELDTDAGCRVPDFPYAIIPLVIGTGPASLEHAQVGDLWTTRLTVLDGEAGNVGIEVSDVRDSAATADDYAGVIASIDFGEPEG
jgi:hypothetical protein